ncbi:hypothetical protein BT69DRAFT_1285038 [Atractiella rhizophila]|nr:hypothetical protein BT69DRAFT_1285038 [Atractiella rhizophila]
MSTAPTTHTELRLQLNRMQAERKRAEQRYQHDLKRLKEENERLRKTQDAGEAQRKQVQIDRLKKELNDAKNAMTASACNPSTNGSPGATKPREKENMIFKEKYERLKREWEEKKANQENLEGIIVILRNEVAVRKRKMEELENELQDALKRENSRSSENNDVLLQVKTEAERSKRKVFELETRCQGLQNQLAQSHSMYPAHPLPFQPPPPTADVIYLQQQVDFHSTRVRQLERELLQLKADHVSLQNAHGELVDRQKPVHNLHNQLATLQHTHNALKTQYDELLKTNNDLNNHISKYAADGWAKKKEKELAESVKREAEVKEQLRIAQETMAWQDSQLNMMRQQRANMKSG